MIARTITGEADAPSPWMKRQKTSASKSCATDAIRLAAPNRPMPASSGPRRPKRSETGP